MSWLVDALNWILLTLGDAVQWLWRDGLGHVGAVFGRASASVNPLLAPMFSGLNRVANAAARVVLAPVAVMPGWLSNTLLSAVAGVLLLIVFKYTSNQKAIAQVRDGIKADLLALKLFKDELSVVFRSQGRLLLGAGRLLRHALFPLAVMIVPVSLMLAQMGTWYQWRPLRVGEEALITLRLSGDAAATMPPVRIESLGGAAVTAGPVRIAARRQVDWRIRADNPGRHTIVFRVGDQPVEKELVVGEGLQRVSARRPGRDWTTILLHPLESPFGRDSVVQSISIAYPGRDSSWAAGTDGWVWYFFLASMVFALIFKPLVKVRI